MTKMNSERKFAKKVIKYAGLAALVGLPLLLVYGKVKGDLDAGKAPTGIVADTLTGYNPHRPKGDRWRLEDVAPLAVGVVGGFMVYKGAGWASKHV